MRVTVLRGVFISSFGTFCVNVAGGPAGGWLLILYAATILPPPPRGGRWGPSSGEAGFPRAGSPHRTPPAARAAGHILSGSSALRTRPNRGPQTRQRLVTLCCPLSRGRVQEGWL